MSRWTFLTNHAYALLCIARDPGLRIRDIAQMVGITERSAQRIVNELVEGGYVSRVRTGNRNCYQIHAELPFRIPIMRHREIGSLVALLGDGAEPKSGGQPAGGEPPGPMMRPA